MMQVCYKCSERKAAPAIRTVWPTKLMSAEFTGLQLGGFPEVLYTFHLGSVLPLKTIETWNIQLTDMFEELNLLHEKESQSPQRTIECGKHKFAFHA